MRTIIRSAWIWFSSVLLILIWFPLLCLVWILDRDPAKYKTGRAFRLLAQTMVKANPAWKLRVSGVEIKDPRRPYVVVSNHQSIADIPFISHLPWEMKWVAKEQLFKIPVAGWMMQLARDIPVNRRDRRSGARALVQAMHYLKQHVPVMFFPEGTRSRDGRVWAFNDGAFGIAIKAGVPILPLAIEGSADCLPKTTWKFGKPSDVHLRVLPPVETAGLDKTHAPDLRDRVRQMIVDEVARLRGVSREEVDALAKAPRIKAM